MSSSYDAHPGLGRDIFGAAELGDRRRTARLVQIVRPDVRATPAGPCPTSWPRPRTCAASTASATPTA